MCLFIVEVYTECLRRETDFQKKQNNKEGTCHTFLYFCLCVSLLVNFVQLLLLEGFKILSSLEGSG